MKTLAPQHLLIIVEAHYCTMNIITGDETGLLKIVNTENGEIIAHGEQGREHAIKGLNWLKTENSFALIRENGLLQIWENKSSSYSMQLSFQSEILSPVELLTFKNCHETVVFNETGKIAVHSFDMDMKMSNSSFQVGGPLSAGATCSDNGAVFGGRERDILFYDVNTQQEVWKAKNVPHDKLSLRVPVWITALSFLRPDSDTTSGSHIAAGTGHKHIRLYDTSAGRQPHATIDIGDQFRVTALHRGSDEFSLYVGDTAGGLYMWDLRTQRRVHTLKGITGSVRSIASNGNGSFVAAVGLDRYLRLYSGKTNKLASSTYMKNRLNRCLVSEGVCGKSMSGASAEDGKAKKEGRSGARVANEGDDDVLERYADSSDEEEEDQSGDSDSQDNLDASSSEQEGESGEEEEEEESDADEEVDFGGGSSDEEEQPSRPAKKGAQTVGSKRVWKTSKPVAKGNQIKQSRR